LAYSYADCMTKNDMGDYKKLLKFLLEFEYKILWPTKIIIFDCSINESISRRKKFQNNIEFKKWFNVSFLNNLKDFYDNELSKIINVKTISIDTTNKTISDVDKTIKKII